MGGAGREGGGDMSRLKLFKSLLIGGASAAVLASGAYADEFNVPGGDLKAALNAYAKQARVALIVSSDVVAGVQTKGVQGDLSADAALSRILDGTGLITHHRASGAVTIVRDDPHPQRSEIAAPAAIRLASASAAASGVETVVVTSSKIKGDIQTVPIAITALVAGTADLAPDRRWSRSCEGSSEPHLLENQFHRLQSSRFAASARRRFR